MEFSKERKDYIWAISTFVFFVLLFACSVLPFYYGIIVGLFSGFLMLVKKTKPASEKNKKIIGIVSLIVTPFLLFFITELLNVNGMTVFEHPTAIIFNFLFFAFIEIFLCFVTKRSDIAIIIMTAIFVLVAIINGYVVEFRGYGFMLSDIHSVETAVNMMNEYTYKLIEIQVLALIAAFILIRVCLNNVVSFKYQKIGSIISFHHDIR